MLISELAQYKPAPLTYQPLVYFTPRTISEAKTLLWDIEVFSNFFYVAFKCYDTGRVYAFERSPWRDFNAGELRHLISTTKLVGFNTKAFDIPILWAAIYGKSTIELKNIANAVISNRIMSWQTEKHFGFKCGFSNDIDLYRVAPSSPTQGQMVSSELKFVGLKQYGARLHAPSIQDLPVHHELQVREDQAAIIRNYCINDLDQTGILYHELKDAIELRERLQVRYEIDLRSKSDAQIAEAVIKNEIQDRQGKKPKSPGVPKEPFSFRCPEFVKFYTPPLRTLLWQLKTTRFHFDDEYKLQPMDGVRNRTVTIDGKDYSVGLGGLHSCEQRQTEEIDGTDMIIDRDVSSFYPSIVLNQGWYPEHIGPDFLNVYRELFDKRITAKKAKRKVESDSLKIVINGTFGKTGNRFSCIYSPWMMVSITLSGQLSLLMLIEMLSIAGIKTISANTDGVVVKIKKEQYDLYLAVSKDWERITGFDTDEVRYKALYQRDVNNYFAIETDGTIKAKGCYVNPFVLKQGAREFMTKNPFRDISIEAAMRYLSTHKNSEPEQIEATIRKCKDIRKFLVVRKVKGGAIKDGHYLGRVVRWYHRIDEFGTINYAGSGNLVPGSGGGCPLMELPKEFPKDIDYSYYVREAHDILKQVGFYNPPEDQKELF